MADRFPTLEDIPLPNVGGARPVAGYDVSPLARGGQALAQGVSNLGQSIEKSAQTVGEYQMAKRRNDALLAQDQIIGDVYKAREEFKHDTGYDDLTDRWDKRVNDIVTKGVQNVPEGMTRDHVMARLQIPLARTRDAVEDYAFNGRSQQAHANIYDRANKLVEQTGAEEDPLVEADVGNFHNRVDEYAQQKLITPLQAQEYKQKLALNRADARVRARIDQAVASNNPGEITKLLGELRNSIPRGGSSIFPPGGWGPTDHAASVVSGAETGDRTIGTKALGNISPDSNGSKSYGFLGLNSGSGSAAAFVSMYGKPFGLTARPGSTEFDAQWQAAAANNTPAFRQAQLRYFNEQIIPGISADLQRHGVPANVAADPRVITYFADRSVQMGGLGKGNIDAAWNGAAGDPVRFLRNMNAIDGTPAELERNFKSAIASGVYSPEGHANRLTTRLAGALAAGAAGGPPGGAAGISQVRGDAQAALARQGINIDVTSADRTPEHNAAVGGARGSQHLQSDHAIDVSLNGLSPEQQQAVVGQFLNDPRVGGFGYYPNSNSIHVDVRPGARTAWGTDYHGGSVGQGWPAWLTGQVQDWQRSGAPRAAGSAPGEEAPAGYSGDPLFAKLTPPHRDALIAHAQAALNQGRTQADHLLKAAIIDDYAAARTTGIVGNARTREDFNAVYGEEEGPAAFQNYNRGLQLNRDLYAMQAMTPEQREQIIAYHESNLHPEAPGYAERYKEFLPLAQLSEKMAQSEAKAAVENKKVEIADLDRRMKDDYEEVRRSGTLGKVIDRDEFIKTLGEQDGEAAWNVYTSGIQHATDMYHLPEQTPEDKLGTERTWEPRPGQPNQEQAWARVGQLRQAADHLHGELQKDPAGYMLRYNPAVRDAWTKMQNAPPDQEAQASQSYADMMIAEQKRFGVEPQDIKVVPDQYADNFKNKVAQLAQAGNSNQIIPLIKAESNRWGSAWPQVYKQVTSGNPMLTVVGAGVKSQAGQLLADNEKLKFGDIVKDELSAKAKDVREGVDTAMAPFASSLAGNAGGVAVYNTFRGQVEKLGALYAFQNGMDAATAAKQAADDVLNFKYDYRDGYRIPAKEHTNPAPVPSDDIQQGAGYARQFLGRKIAGIDLAVRPAIDTFGGAYTPAQLASETADAKRNGRWTTNSDETGLAYTYNGQVVRRPDGAPLVLTWQQLGHLAKEYKRESSEPFKGLGGPL